MSKVIIKFENEKAEGIVAVGTYLIDAAKRLGIKIDCDCFNEEVETKGSCAVKITNGKTLLSSPTKLETELLTATQRKNGERLACQTKIEKAGEVTIMTKEKKVSEEEKKDQQEATKEEFKKQFEELPLEKKIANLMELEAIALSETFSFVVNSPYAAVGKVFDVLAGFGLKMEKSDQDAKRPDEHIKKEDNTDSSATDNQKEASKKSDADKSDVKKTTRKKTTKKKAETKKEESE